MQIGLSKEQQERVCAFFESWCDAHKLAGLQGDAIVLVSPLGQSPAAEVSIATGAPDQGGSSGELIPDGTLAWASVLVRPFNLDQGLVLTPSKSTEGNAYLDVELTILEGPHARRKVWDVIVIKGEEKDRMMAMAKVRHILEVGREIQGFSPNDAKYRLTNGIGDMVLMDLNELRCAIKVGIDKGKGDYSDKNKVSAYLSPNPASDTFNEYGRLVAGDTAPPATRAKSSLPAPAPATVPLKDPAGIAQAYMRALGEYDGENSQFCSLDEWEIAAGAAVGILGPDGSIATVV